MIALSRETLKIPASVLCSEAQESADPQLRELEGLGDYVGAAL